MQPLLKRKLINGWWLFLWMSLPMSLLIVITTAQADLSTGAGVSQMIGYSVRWAVPFIYLVMAASAVQTLFPGPITMYWLRNRKYIGLVFALAMAWQGLFIAIMSLLFRDYYYENVYYFRDELEGSTGYIFLTALVVTSFSLGRRYLDHKQWKLMHRWGVYFLWAYAFSVYWWNLHYYKTPDPIDYLFYWSGFLAVGLRIAAWGKRRQMAIRKTDPGFRRSKSATVLGAMLILLGLLLAATGLSWQEPVTAFLTAPSWSATLTLWLPFWPFEPFLSLFVIGLGTAVLSRTSHASPGAVLNSR